MNIHIFAIGGKWNPIHGGSEFVGTAINVKTAQSLLDLVESKGGYAVSLHGNNISGEFSIKDARKIFETFDED
jgi:hypothetical protein